MPNKSISFLISIFIIFSSTTLFSGENRSKNRFGIYFSAREPAPGSIGLNVAYNFSSYFRLHAGASYYSNASDRLGDEIGTTMISTMTYLLTMGQIGYTKIREFYDDEFDKEKVKYIFARGVGFKLFHPTWKISPSVGVAYNKQTSKNQPYSMKEQNTYLTYSAGIDYQMRVGFQCSLGVNYSPELPSSAAKRIYGNIGFFF